MAQLRDPGVQVEDLVLEGDPADLMREPGLEAGAGAAQVVELVLDLDPDDPDLALFLEETALAFDEHHAGQRLLELHREDVQERFEVGGVGADGGGDELETHGRIPARELVHPPVQYRFMFRPRPHPPHRSGKGRYACANYHSSGTHKAE